MSKLKTLESKKLMKELDFIESDYELKNEIISEADVEFLNTVSTFLNDRPDIKELFDKKVNSKIEKMIEKKEQEIKDISENLEEDIIEETEIEVISKEKSPKIKKIYREIVKLTHPDKVSDVKSNDLYIKSTKFYDEDDLTSLYSICNILNIEYEIDEGDNELISDKISKLKSRIDFMESTFTFKWYNSADDKEKELIVFTYIKMQLES